MSALAQVLCQRGHRVSGSDRTYDRGLNRRLFAKLQAQGITLFPQGGTQMPPDLDCMVVSTAIEASNPELRYAREHALPVVHRAEVLAGMFNSSRGIGVAGTSGKSTVTGMIASILDHAGMPATVVNGGIINGYASRVLVGNARNADSDLMVTEVDESDGSIRHFVAHIGVITNISRDHKELGELQALFREFAGSVAGRLVVNGDCPELRAYRSGNVLTYGLGEHNAIRASRMAPAAWGSTFACRESAIALQVPGRHNVYNALAAIGVAEALGIPLAACRRGLASFRGIRRRLERSGCGNGITVVDDFAHNPDKIAASLEALKRTGQRRIIIFQPHGYGPTRFMLTDLARAFSSGLSRRDVLICLAVYDAGGTADRSIASSDLLRAVTGPELLDMPERSAVASFLAGAARPGDVIAVMGARDDTLRGFAQAICRRLCRGPRPA
jgi:UDP-N-acetylmuramate--alanine ligase